MSDRFKTEVRCSTCGAEVGELCRKDEPGDIRKAAPGKCPDFQARGWLPLDCIPQALLELLRAHHLLVNTPAGAQPPSDATERALRISAAREVLDLQPPAGGAPRDGGSGSAPSPSPDPAPVAPAKPAEPGGDALALDELPEDFPDHLKPGFS